MATMQADVAELTQSPPVAAEHKPEVIGDYEILGKLGQGGMGAVYRARQVSLDRVVALKILPSNLEEDENFVARFQREAAVAAGLNHPNLVQVYTSGCSEGCHFPLNRPLQTGKDYDLELRVVGQTLTAKLNDEILGSVTDETFAEGQFGVATADHNHPASLVKSLEVLDPDTPAVTTPAAATKAIPFTNSLGMKFVPVPIPGGPTDKQRVLFSIWETRVQDYAAYVAANPQADGSWKTQNKDGVPVSREPEHPVVGVNWEDAQAFCQWLTAKETAGGQLPPGMRYRLPSDEEWSSAAGLPAEPGAMPAEKSGKNTVDFPWGRDWPLTHKVGNYADESFHAKFPLNENANGNFNKNRWMERYTDGYATTAPVGSFPANTQGLYDMGGNVRQWCEDWFDQEQKQRVLRGASWNNYDREGLLLSYRYGHTPDHRGNHYGFRVVLVSAP